MRSQIEHRSGGKPPVYYFTNSLGNTSTSLAPYNYNSFSQVTSSFRTAGGNSVAPAIPHNRQEYIAYLKSNQDRKYDTGHEFWTEKSETIISHPKVTVRGGSGILFQGPLIPLYLPSAGQQYIPIPAWTPDTVGASLVRRAIPTQPLNNAIVSLGELALPGGIPSAYTKFILKSVLKSSRYTKLSNQLKTGFRAAGDVALTAQFGYVPIVSDIVGAVGAVEYGANFIKQLERDSGRLVHRTRYNDPISSYTGSTFAGTSELMGLGYAAFDRASLYSSSADATGNVNKTEFTSQQMWFSGGFEYIFKNAMSSDNAIDSILNRVEKLAGIRLTPDRIYQLTPFSWLVDWNSTLGDVINNAQRFSEDGLIMRYGYVMRTSITVRSYVLTGIRFKQFNPGPISWSYRTTRKERVRGNPFGFGGNPSGYNSRQWGILSALGMTGGVGTTIRRY